MEIRGVYEVAIRVRELERAKQSLQARGVEVEGPLRHGWIPAAPLYFSDPDGHALELCVPIQGPPSSRIGAQTR